MSTTAPSSWAVMNAGNELAEIRARLVAICPDIEDDQTLFADMLEGEAPDALAVIERLIDAAVAAEALADAVKIRQDNLALRKARFERQSEAYRAVALQQLERIKLRRLQRPQWTASIANRVGKVVITDATAVPQSLNRVTVEPNKSAIAAEMKAGRDVPGACWSNPEPSLTVRVR